MTSNQVIQLLQANRDLRNENQGLLNQVKRLAEKLKAAGADDYAGKYKTNRTKRPRPGGIKG